MTPTTQFDPTEVPIHWPKPAEPASATEHSRDELETAFKTSAISHLNLVTTVPKYRAASKPDWEAAMKRANEESLAYRSTYFSCVEFAALMKGALAYLTGLNGVGWVLGYDVHHSFNALLVTDAAGKLTIELAEPQTDKFADLAGPNAKDYAAMRGQVVF